MRGEKDKPMKSNGLCKQNSLRYAGYALLLLIGIFALTRLLYSSETNVIESAVSVVGYAPDRSEAYNVKVIPASLDDAALNQLPKETFSFLAMIDAGSSGCRAHIYRFGKLGTITGPLYVLPEHESMKVRPGLSTFADNPQDAGKSLQGLIDFMKSQVPESDWATTPIWLKATAGLRMLPPEKAEAVLDSVRAFLGDKANSPFLFRPSWAKVIPGNEEGGFGWIAYNYLKKLIGPKRVASAETPYAVVEMGGASAQVSQLAPSEAEAQKIPQEYRFEFTIEKSKYTLYTHSYLGFGAEQGRQQLNKLMLQAKQSKGAAVVEDPCLNTGYTRPAAQAPGEPYQGPAGETVQGAASAQAGQCALTLKTLFNRQSGGDSTCSETAVRPFSFDCTYQPAFVAESKNFLTFENFYYVSSALGVKPASDAQIQAQLGASVNLTALRPNGGSGGFPLLTTPQNLLEATQAFCGKQWAEAQTSYPVDAQPKDVNTKMCFVGAFAYSFLVDGLKLSPQKVITVQKDVGDSEIEWALGAAYKETADLLKRTNLRPT